MCVCVKRGSRRRNAVNLLFKNTMGKGEKGKLVKTLPQRRCTQVKEHLKKRKTKGYVLDEQRDAAQRQMRCMLRIGSGVGGCRCSPAQMLAGARTCQRACTCVSNVTDTSTSDKQTGMGIGVHSSSSSSSSWGGGGQ